jgi:NAD(P)-dependent dehydrogenase (short-subunit alcohol dehydrogenase family)
MKPVVFITGGSRGIGLATAKKFSKMGWSVVSFYKTKPGPKVPNCKYYQLDVSKLVNVEVAFSQAFKESKKIDCLVNNAGMFAYKKGLADFDEDLIDQVISVNEKGMYFCTKVIQDKLKIGSIINISSTVAHVGGSDPIYSGTKAAVLGFTKSMAKNLAPNVRVNAVAPGATNTDMMRNYNPERIKQLVDATLLKRMAEPEDIANAIYFLASNDARHITGICLDVTGGYVMR